MTRDDIDDGDAQTDTITFTVEIDPGQFDEPRQLMWERLCERYGRDRIADLVRANVDRDVTAQGMGLVNALWDNRDRIEVEPGGVDADALGAQPGGHDD